jgi:hypothetical protein
VDPRYFEVHFEIETGAESPESQRRAGSPGVAKEVIRMHRRGDA